MGRCSPERRGMRCRRPPLVAVADAGPPARSGGEEREGGSTTASSAWAHPYRPASARGSRPGLRPVLAMAGSNDTSAAPFRSVAVVDAGVSGLAAAYRLRKSGVNVTVFEASDRAGGKIRSNTEGGFIWDEGANTGCNFDMDALALQQRCRRRPFRHRAQA